MVPSLPPPPGEPLARPGPPLHRLRARIRGLRPGVYADLLGDTFAYTLAGALVRSVSMFAIPFLARTFTVSDLGVVELLTTVMFTISMLAGLSLDTALMRYYYEAPSMESRRLQVTAITVASLVIAVAVALAVAATARPISSWLFGTPAHAAGIVVAALAAPCMTVGTLALTVLRLERRRAAFTLLSVLSSAVYLGTIVAVALWWRSVTVAAAAQLAAYAVLAAGGAWAVRSHFVGRFEPSTLRTAWRFSLPLYPSLVISWYLSQANRFLLVWLSSLATVGVFSAASRAHAPVLFAAQAFLSAWKPFALMNMKREDALRTYSVVMGAVVACLSLATVAAALLARPFLVLYAGPAYGTAAMTVGLLVLGTCLGYGFGSFYALRLELLERTAHISVAQAVTFVATTAFSLALIPAWGAEGAAMAIVGGTLAQALALRAASRRFDTFREPAWVFVLPLAGAAALVLARLSGLA